MDLEYTEPSSWTPGSVTASVEYVVRRVKGGVGGKLLWPIVLCNCAYVQGGQRPPCTCTWTQACHKALDLLAGH